VRRCDSRRGGRKSCGVEVLAHSTSQQLVNHSYLPPARTSLRPGACAAAPASKTELNSHWTINISACSFVKHACAIDSTTTCGGRRRPAACGTEFARVVSHTSRHEMTPIVGAAHVPDHSSSSSSSSWRGASPCRTDRSQSHHTHTQPRTQRHLRTTTIASERTRSADY